MPITTVTFPAGSLVLEGLLHLPEGSAPSPGVVVCHPHPLYGGNMHNLVVAEICRCLNERGIIALRFNFRSVGSSQGSHGEGIGEQEDVRGALSHLASLAGVDPERLGVTGYSFGAFVALAAGAADPRAKVLCGIAPPVAHVDMSFLKDSTKPEFFIFGSRDEITPLVPFMALYQQLQGENRYQVVQGADHFLFSYEGVIAEAVADYFASML